MAYDLSQDEEENQGTGQAQGQGQAQQGANQEIGPQAGAVLNSPTPGSSKGPSKSGNWTNLQSYLDANQGQGFGGQFAGKVQGDVDSANQAVSSADQGFRGQVDSGTTKYNSDLVNSAVSDPSTFVNDPSKIQQFNAQRDANYSGPSALSDYSSGYNQAQTAVTDAKQSANAAQSEGGRFALLDKYFGGTGSGYNQGQKNLDNFLVQSDPNAQGQLAQSTDAAQKAANNFNTTQTQDQAYAAQGKGATEAAQNQTRAALGIDSNGNVTQSGAIGNLQTNLNNQVTADQTAQTNLYNQALTGLKSGTISAADSKALGIDPAAYANYTQAPAGQATIGGLSKSGTPFGGTASNQIALYGVDPSKYLNKSAAPTAQTVASADDYAKMAALSKLAGIDNTFLPTANASAAGTYSQNGTFDNTSLMGAIGAAKAANATSIQNAESGTTIKVPTYMAYYSPSGSPPPAPNPDGTLSMDLATAQAAYQNAQTPGYKPASPVAGSYGAPNDPGAQSAFYQQNIAPQIDAILAKYAPNYLKITS